MTARDSFDCWTKVDDSPDVKPTMAQLDAVPETILRRWTENGWITESDLRGSLKRRAEKKGGGE